MMYGILAVAAPVCAIPVLNRAGGAAKLIEVLIRPDEMYFGQARSEDLVKDAIVAAIAEAGFTADDIQDVTIDGTQLLPTDADELASKLGHRKVRITIKTGAGMEQALDGPSDKHDGIFRYFAAQECLELSHRVLALFASKAENVPEVQAEGGRMRKQWSSLPHVSRLLSEHGIDTDEFDKQVSQISELYGPTDIAEPDLHRAELSAQIRLLRRDVQDAQPNLSRYADKEALRFRLWVLDNVDAILCDSPSSSS
eukprot:TRINITY_DN3252_c0_g1_i1.p1 TRINITY_DN3252_c0_g1~~TRINITY_DN3252_c0_g1_i1.p1  ORF type:complete len:254 (-),score=36.71 TRINITY_DN3252_c0_g1_i1:216-977(-)